MTFPFIYPLMVVAGIAAAIGFWLAGSWREFKRHYSAGCPCAVCKDIRQTETRANARKVVKR